jgi:hypothetical protein
MVTPVFSSDPLFIPAAHSGQSRYFYLCSHSFISRREFIHPLEVFPQPTDALARTPWGVLELIFRISAAFRRVHVKELLLRFVVGGVVVSGFALLGDLLKPKSFAGLFGAAPSVALATLALTVMKDGKAYASTEGRSMILGAAAFVIYAWIVGYVLIRRRSSVLGTTSAALALWLVCALGLWFALIR